MAGVACVEKPAALRAFVNPLRRQSNRATSNSSPERFVFPTCLAPDVGKCSSGSESAQVGPVVAAPVYQARAQAHLFERVLVLQLDVEVRAVCDLSTRARRRKESMPTRRAIGSPRLGSVYVSGAIDICLCSAPQVEFNHKSGSVPSWKLSTLTKPVT